MPFPPALGADPDSANSAFLATFEAYLAAPYPGGDVPSHAVALSGVPGDADVPAAGTRTAGAECPATSGTYLGGFLGYAGGADGALPDPPVPDYGPMGYSTGAAGTSFPPALGADPDAGNPAVVGTFQAYLGTRAESWTFLPRLSGGFDVPDPVVGALGKNQVNDPAGAQAPLDGRFGVFVGEAEPPFTTARLPRLAFGPFRNLAGLTYQVELDAFAKFGLTRIQYRIWASGQSPPPYNDLSLAGQNGFSTDLVHTLGNAAADIRAEAIVTDVFGNRASQTAVLPGIPDVESPTAPPFLYIAQMPDGTWLFVWGTSSDDFVVDHYRIDQVDEGGEPVAVFAANIRQNYFTTSGENLAGRRYRVVAFDPVGNTSAASPIATAAGNVVAESRVRNVLARQIPGTATVHVTWDVAPLGTPYVAQIVDARERPLSEPVVSPNGQATLTLLDPTKAGIFRVRVSPA